MMRIIGITDVDRLSRVKFMNDNKI